MESALRVKTGVGRRAEHVSQSTQKIDVSGAAADVGEAVRTSALRRAVVRKP
jgi:hypothetical protein